MTHRKAEMILLCLARMLERPVAIEGQAHMSPYSSMKVDTVIVVPVRVTKSGKEDENGCRWRLKWRISWKAGHIVCYQTNIGVIRIKETGFWLNPYRRDPGITIRLSDLLDWITGTEKFEIVEDEQFNEPMLFNRNRTFIVNPFFGKTWEEVELLAGISG